MLCLSVHCTSNTATGDPLLYNQSPFLTPVGEVVVAAADVVVRATLESQDSTFKGCRGVVEEYVQSSLGFY